jgi:hypothetical protein
MGSGLGIGDKKDKGKIECSRGWEIKERRRIRSKYQRFARGGKIPFSSGEGGRFSDHYLDPGVIFHGISGPRRIASWRPWRSSSPA